jgi:hypothetical protein
VAITQILWIVLPILLTRWSIRAGARWAAAEQKALQQPAGSRGYVDSEPATEP